MDKRLWITGLMILTLAFGGSMQAFASPLVFTASTDAAAMVTNILGPGIMVVGTPAYASGATGMGSFTGGTGILGFDAGIVLSSGNIYSLPGPNISGSTSTSWDMPGYGPLDVLSGGTTHDAAVLSFSFIPTAGVVSFRFVFGSEEYNEYVGSAYNDAFGFFLNGTNIALIPGTGSPVTINSVNLGSNPTYYTNNTGGLLNTELDGLVGVSRALYATGLVTAGEVNTIALAIADTSDHIYDSAVFIQGQSFIPEPPPVPLPGTMLLLGSGIIALAGLGWRSKKV